MTELFCNQQAFDNLIELISICLVIFIFVMALIKLS